MTKRHPALIAVLFGSMTLAAQTAPQANQPAAPAPNPAADANASRGNVPKEPNKAEAYYHYTMAHLYEELVAVYQQAEYANKAIEEYKLAIQNDPTSEYLNAGLAELYAKTGRIRDAVLEAQEILKRDPNNVEAHRLLGRIYLKSLGDTQGGTQSQELLKRAISEYEEIVKIDPKSVDDHLLLGRLYRINNETTKAENEFKTAVQIDPNSEDALTTLAILYTEMGEPQKAQQLLETVPGQTRSPKLYGTLGYAFEQQKDYKRAIDAYTKALEEDKDNLDLRRSLAQTYMADGQNDASLQQYKIVVDSDPQDAATYMRMAEIYRRTGRFNEALESLNRAQTFIQDSLELPYNKAVILQTQGKYEEAIALLQGLVAKTEKANTSGEKNNRAVFLERLGTIYKDTGKTQAAVDTFRKMVPLGDENASRGYQEIIDTYRQAKNWQQATVVAQESVKALPKDRMLKLTLAQQLADTGQADAGLQMGRELLKNTPDDREIHIALAQIEGRLKRYKEAEADLNKALELSTRQEEKDYALFVQASLLERQKRYDEAEQIFRRLLSQDPNNTNVLNYLGFMLADRGVRLDEALGMLKKAVQLEPQNGAYLDSIGWAYFKLGNFDLAEDNLRRAAERVANDPTILDHLGDLYARTGRLKLAAAQWERALGEWGRSVPAEVDSNDVAKVQKKLESAKVKLARQQGERSASAKPAPEQ